VAASHPRLENCLLRMEVHALRRIFDANGSPFLLSEGGTETNDRGEYRIPGLKTGWYYMFPELIP
jgi:hypothetical protein